MTKGDRFINGLTLDIYTYEDTDEMGYIVLVNKDGEIRQVGESFFQARYFPYSEEMYLRLKNSKKVVRVCEKSVDGLDLNTMENAN